MVTPADLADLHARGSRLVAHSPESELWRDTWTGAVGRVRQRLDAVFIFCPTSTEADCIPIEEPGRFALIPARER